MYHCRLLLTSEQSRELGFRRSNQICRRLTKDWERRKEHLSWISEELMYKQTECERWWWSACHISAVTCPWLFQYNRLGSITTTSTFTSHELNKSTTTVHNLHVFLSLLRSSRNYFRVQPRVQWGLVYDTFRDDREKLKLYIILPHTPLQLCLIY